MKVRGVEDARSAAFGEQRLEHSQPSMGDETQVRITGVRP